MTGMWSGTPPASQIPLATCPGQVAEVPVARHQVGTGVGDGDVRAAVEGVVRQTAAHPGPVDVAVPIRAGVPVLAATLAHGTSVHP